MYSYKYILRSIFLQTVNFKIANIRKNFIKQQNPAPESAWNTESNLLQHKS